MDIDTKKLDDFSEAKRREALRRLGIIQRFEKFAAKFAASGAGGRADAAEIFAAENSLGVATLYRWIRRSRDEGIAGLVDSRGGGAAGGKLSPEAFEQFKAMYLNQRRLSVKLCWQNLKYINKSENRGWQIPSLRSMYRYEQLIPKPVRVLHREGLDAYKAKCAPYIQSDPDSVQPGQIWVGDHHQLNLWVRHKAKWLRPWLTAWQDMASRALVGWVISPSPNQTTILRAFKQAAEVYGPPESVKIDNGRDYDSEMWTGTTKAKRRALGSGYLDQELVAGVYAMLGVGVSFAIPYNAQGKRVERLFDTIDQQLSKTIVTYCGKDAGRKPDDLNTLLLSQDVIDDAYNLDSFAELFAKYAETYNFAKHSGEGMNGQSPAQVMAQRPSRRALADGVLDLICRVWTGKLKVGKNGVRLNGMYYGQFSMELAAHQGKFVRVAYDPGDMRHAWVYDADSLVLLARVEQNQLIAYGAPASEDAVREASRRKSRALKAAKAYRSTELDRNRDLSDLTIAALREGAQEPEEQPHTVKPVRTKLDRQVDEHKKIQRQQAIKKAAGAENQRQPMVIDYDAMIEARGIRKPKRKSIFGND